LKELTREIVDFYKKEAVAGVGTEKVNGLLFIGHLHELSDTVAIAGSPINIAGMLTIAAKNHPSLREIIRLVNNFLDDEEKFKAINQICEN